MANKHEGLSVITGASSGIGAALALELAGPGQSLVLFGRDESRLEQVAQQCTAKGAHCFSYAVDITDRTAMARAMDEVRRQGKIHTFIANAGVLGGRPEDGLIEDAQTAHRVIDTNLTAAIDTLHMVLPGMIERGSGRILMVASIAAIAPLPDAPAYSASKAGLLSYGLALRDALLGTGIMVCVTCPGYVRTRMTDIHLGWRPGEISAQDAARKMVRAMERGKGLSGFPFSMYWAARIGCLVPAWLRRRIMNSYRFHVAD